MSNYIKIPLADNPARAVKTGTFAGTAADGGTIGGSTVSDAQDLTGGSGTGLQATVQKGTGTDITTATITITDGGQNYKVNDQVTIPIITADGTKTTTTEPIVLTLAASDLVASSGSDTNEYAVVPVDNVACVHEDSATSVIIQLKQIVAGGSGEGDGPIMQYAVTMDNSPAITKEQLWADVSAAIAKAASAENSQPEVKFTNNAECLSVVLS